MFGHMNNVTPFVYFEEARISYFKHLGVMDLHCFSSPLVIKTPLRLEEVRFFVLFRVVASEEVFKRLNGRIPV